MKIIKEANESGSDRLEALRSFLINSEGYSSEDVEGLELVDNNGYPSAELNNGSEYYVLTDEEANARATEDILNSLWAFNPDFIIEHTDFYNEASSREVNEAVKALRQLQSSLSDSANLLIKALINDNLDKFVDDAIESDGRGQFISWYDGEENKAGNFYIYRVS